MSRTFHKTKGSGNLTCFAFPRLTTTLPPWHLCFTCGDGRVLSALAEGEVTVVRLLEPNAEDNENTGCASGITQRLLPGASQIPFRTAACKYRTTGPFVRSQVDFCFNWSLHVPALPRTRPSLHDHGGGHLLTDTCVAEGRAALIPASHPRKRNLSRALTISSWVGSLSKIFMGGGRGVCDSSSGSSSPQPFLLF